MSSLQVHVLYGLVGGCMRAERSALNVIVGVHMTEDVSAFMWSMRAYKHMFVFVIVHVIVIYAA